MSEENILRQLKILAQDISIADKLSPAHHKAIIQEFMNDFTTRCAREGIDPASEEANTLFDELLSKHPGAEEAFETFGDFMDGTL